MTVFVVQKPTRKKGDTFVEMFDLSPAEEFGELKTLFDSSVSPFTSDPHHLVNKLWRKFEGYSGDSDYILCVGNPVLIGWSVAVAAQLSPGSRVTCLQWNNKKQVYFPVTVDIL